MPEQVFHQSVLDGLGGRQVRGQDLGQGAERD